MMIEHVFPQVIGETAPLRDVLRRHLIEAGEPPDHADALLAIAPEPLIGAGAFWDKMTGLWRYEFGVPFEINGSQVWGAHMWVPVAYLGKALKTVNRFLGHGVRAEYLARLNHPERHAITLAEMIPGSKLAAAAHAEFEVPGLGVGNSTVDWLITGIPWRILLDVKSRSGDFIEQMAREGDAREMPEPEHDPALLFRNLEGKFVAADPDTQLQGAWIATHIAQPRQGLQQAFDALDPARVHFAILGDWDRDIHLLVKREADRAFLMALFDAVPSARFTFDQ